MLKAGFLTKALAMIKLDNRSKPDVFENIMVYFVVLVVVMLLIFCWVLCKLIGDQEK